MVQARPQQLEADGLVSRGEIGGRALVLGGPVANGGLESPPPCRPPPSRTRPLPTSRPFPKGGGASCQGEGGPGNSQRD